MRYTKSYYKQFLHSYAGNCGKNRCSCKYGGKKSDGITKNIHVTVNCISIYYLVNRLEWFDPTDGGCKVEVKVTQICWIKPTTSQVKLNTDGSDLTIP